MKKSPILSAKLIPALKISLTLNNGPKTLLIPPVKGVTILSIKEFTLVKTAPINCCIAQAGAFNAFLTNAVNMSSTTPCRELITFEVKQFIPLKTPAIGPTKAVCALVTTLSACLKPGIELNIFVAIELNPP